MRKARCCPACGRPLPPRFKLTGWVTPRLVEIIASRPDGISRMELADLLYGADPDGGPDSLCTVSVLVARASKRLKDQGFRITRAPYRLEPI